jgi:RNA polymerase sigma-70 factor, ECF subfamily
LSYLASEYQKGSAPAPHLPSLDDDRLVRFAKGGAQWAMEELVHRYRNKAFGVAYHLCSGQKEDAEDFTQEAFLRAFRNLKNFRGNSSFYTWFYRILVNVCLDGKRRRNRWQKLIFPWRPTRKEQVREAEAVEGHSDTMKELSNKQLSQDIARAMGALPEKQRVAFQLKALQGMSIGEIAQVMGTAEGTVKSHLFRATHALRQALKDWEE